MENSCYDVVCAFMSFHSNVPGPSCTFSLMSATLKARCSAFQCRL